MASDEMSAKAEPAVDSDDRARQQFEALMAAGLAFFDRIEAGVDTAYPAISAQRDLDGLLSKVSDLEQSMETEMLHHLPAGQLESFQSLTLPTSLRVERAKIEGELHGVQRSADAAATRLSNHRALLSQRQARPNLTSATAQHQQIRVPQTAELHRQAPR